MIMKEMYSKAVKSLKSKVKHSKEEIPKAMGLRAIGVSQESRHSKKSPKKKVK
jgi:hypothetical protein